MKIKINLLFTFLFLLPVFFLKSQTATTGTPHEVKGKITDDVTGEPLVGASISYATGKGTQTDINGAFSLQLPDGKYDIKISYIGYTPILKKVRVDGQDQTLDKLQLVGTNNLDEVEIAADIAKTRETPVAFSDVDAKQITEELGSNDITMLLNSTPGSYASQQGGGAGDSRVTIRGFDQRNIAVLVDGIPVNDMENGQVYWSNWAGLSEVTKKMQVQRGLGASRLAVPSVGGVMNIITTPVDQKQFFTVKENMGSGNYQRFSAGYNSGLLKNKFGIVLAGSYTQSDGIIDQTWLKAWSYFGKISYKANDKNLFVLGFSGSPQSHGQRSFAVNMAFHDRTYAMEQGVNTDSVYKSNNPYTTVNVGSRGTTYSPDWGYLNGKPFTAKINYFHKPLVNLSYFLTINPRSSFSNVLYYSNGNGGGTTITSFQYDKYGTGQLDVQALYNANMGSPSSTLAGLTGQKAAAYYQYASINNHNWIGTLSTFKYRQSNKLEYLGGLDARYYVGTHYQTPYDMIGANYVNNSADLNANPSDYLNSAKYIGDKINYYYQSKITWLGLFGQAEYKTKKTTAFITVTGNQTGLQVINYFAKKDLVIDDKNTIYKAVGYGDTLYTDGTNVAVANGIPPVKHPDGSVTVRDVTSSQNITLAPGYKTYNNSSSQARTNTSPVRTYFGYTAKGGVNRKLNANNNVFVNVGHMSLTPRFTNIYDRSGAAVKNPQNQLIFTGELGYTLKYKTFAANVNGYLTQWSNKPLDFGAQSKKIDPATQLPIYYNINGIDALLKGLEFDFNYKPVKYLEFRGFGAVADWRWNSSGAAYAYAENGTALDSVVFNAKGVHIGNAPQVQLGGSVRFEITRGFYIKPQFTYFDKMYAQFDPTQLKQDGPKDYRQMDSWRMPSFGIFDLYIGYKILGEKSRIELNVVMNNVLNTVYMTDASFSTTPDNYDATHSYGWMGLPRRINIGAKVTF